MISYWYCDIYFSSKISLLDKTNKKWKELGEKHWLQFNKPIVDIEEYWLSMGFKKYNTLEDLIKNHFLDLL